MSFKTWWQRRQEILLKEELDSSLKTYLKDYHQSPIIHRRMLAQQYLPRIGEDLLAKKELFLCEYSIHEHEFRRKYLIRRRANRFISLYSLELEEKSRLAAHKKWREMLDQFQQNQKSKTR